MKICFGGRICNQCVGVSAVLAFNEKFINLARCQDNIPEEYIINVETRRSL
jgi:hypothetical protein